MSHRSIPQPICPLLTIPNELKRAIYAHILPQRIHLNFEHDSITFTPCIKQDCDDEWFLAGENDARSASRAASHSTSIRRVRSSWGSHWMCEEASHEGRYDVDAVKRLLLVCKRMFIDVIEVMAGTIGWYINDVVTLNRLFMTHAEGTGYGTDLSSEFLRHFVPNVKELHIVLNLPRSDYEGLERFPAPREIASSTSPSTSDLLKATWLRIPTAINSMHHLQKLNIWLDLNAPFSWSILNERAILSPLLPFHNSPTNILINLPILHPKHENPSRHFTSDTDPFPIPIHRRYRAQIRTATASNGSVYEMVRLDYPQCSDFASFMLCDGDIGGDEVNVTREEEEEWERRQWKMGRDPVKEFRDFIVEMDRGLCGLGTI